MPTYSYECQACGTKFEQYQKFEDKPITKCPTCKKNKVRRVFTPASIVFKGSGWYKTDSRSKSTSTARGEKSADKSDDKASDKSGEKAADSAPAAEKSSENGGSDTSSKAAPKKEAAASKSKSED
jgi:putative FmdB family regulatory protein